MHICSMASARTPWGRGVAATVGSSGFTPHIQSAQSAVLCSLALDQSLHAVLAQRFKFSHAFLRCSVSLAGFKKRYTAATAVRSTLTSDMVDEQIWNQGLDINAKATLE